MISQRIWGGPQVLRNHAPIDVAAAVLGQYVGRNEEQQLIEFVHVLQRKRLLMEEDVVERRASEMHVLVWLLDGLYLVGSVLHRDRLGRLRVGRHLGGREVGGGRVGRGGHLVRLVVGLVLAHFALVADVLIWRDCSVEIGLDLLLA